MTKTLRALITELEGKSLLVSVGNEKFNIDSNNFESYSEDEITFIRVKVLGKDRYINLSKIKYFEII